MKKKALSAKKKLAAAKKTGRKARLAAREPIVKTVWKPGTMLCPVPAVMVTCVDPEGRPNIITIAWAGTVCSDPPMLSISLRKATYSYGLIMESREFVVNVPTVRQVRAMDYCGMVSGRDTDKFAQTGLTPAPAATVKAPLILECPINIECAVRQVHELGLHTMFVAEVTSVQVSQHLITASGQFTIEQAGLVAFAHGAYFAIGKRKGQFGFSRSKKKPPK